MLKIYFEEDSERREHESIERGCRLDVLVEIDGKYYEPIINTIERLAQEVNEAFEDNKIYDIDPCQILVKEANKELIIKSIVKLYQQSFFKYFNPIDLNKYKTICEKLIDIKNWVQVY
ncbi:MAG: hypothetical protein J6Y68_00325 [Clostridia bacterium]|nr:hypothetical protein [Clostridia bacterium]MBP5648762.1 hypothetical protein [Clostridia bacterium]